MGRDGRCEFRPAARGDSALTHTSLSHDVCGARDFPPGWSLLCGLAPRVCSLFPSRWILGAAVFVGNGTNVLNAV